MVSLLIENFMQIDEDRHLKENAIESLAMGSLHEDAVAEAEQHLLICETCRDRVMDAESYVRAMRRASQHLPLELEKSRRRFRFFVPAMVFSTVLIIVAAILFATQGPRRSPVPIQLLALRGAETQAHGPARRPLLLQPDLRGLPAATAFGIEVVDISGSTVWRGVIDAQVQPPTSLVPAQRRGAYFVRVSLPSGELLREYALELRGQD